MTKTLVTTSALIAFAGVASANIVTPSTRSPLDTAFLPGMGNSNTDFAISDITEVGGAFDGNQVELGMKVKRRFFGQTGVGGSSNIYEVQTGFSPVDGSAGSPDDTSRAWWNFDFSVDFGSRTTTNTTVILTITDPENDSIIVPQPGGAPGVPVNNTLYQNSWNTGFGFINAGYAIPVPPSFVPGIGFDVNLLGDYILTLTAIDNDTQAEIGNVTAIARVVPTPASAALLGLSGLAALRRRR